MMNVEFAVVIAVHVKTVRECQMVVLKKIVTVFVMALQQILVVVVMRLLPVAVIMHVVQN